MLLTAISVGSRQNNVLLSELSSKVTALRGVTVDIYDNARNQDVIDSTVRSLIPIYMLRGALMLESCRNRVMSSHLCQRP